jgi:hypothetical protein
MGDSDVGAECFVLDTLSNGIGFATEYLPDRGNIFNSQRYQVNIPNRTDSLPKNLTPLSL